MTTRKKLFTTIALVFGILVLLNFLANRFFFRLDFTEDSRYSLSGATENILEDLGQPVTVTAYFSENLPPDIEQVRNDFRDLLVEYNRRSGGNVVYEFLNPAETEETEMQAMQSGIQPIMINVREKDQLKQQKAYLGAVIKLGDKKETIPFIQPGAAMEFALSTNIEKLSSVNKPKVAVITGHGEPSLRAMPQLQQQLSVMYDVSEITLTDTSAIPAEYNLAMIIAPADSIPANHLVYLDEFIGRGGRLIAAVNAVEGNLQSVQGEAVFTGLEDWLAGKGINIGKEFVIDANAASVTVQQRQGFFVMNTPVRFPYLPVITNFADHPVSTGLEAVIMQFVSPVSYEGSDTTVKFIPLALSSENSGVAAPPVHFDINKEWTREDFGKSGIPVGAAIEGNLNGTNTRLVVFGDGDFVVNGEGQQAQRLQDDNISLMVNSLDWLSDDTGLIELRTKGVTARPIDPSIEEGTKAAFKYTNFLLPIVLIIGYGIFRAQVRRKKRKQLSTVDYV